jgi:hypothetical protein
MEKKPEDNKEKKEKMTYEPPELIDLAGEVARGAPCNGGSIATLICSLGGSVT